MKAASLCGLASSLLAGAQFMSAEARAAVPAGPIPLNDPGEWIGTGDYPAAALRHNISGVTAFRLAIDATGKPSRCEIAQSSGFDILDKATCERVITNARFAPARDQAGKPVEGSYAGRIRWVVPAGDRILVTERFVSIILEIDMTGKVTSCQILRHVSPDASALPKSSCDKGALSSVTEDALELRRGFQGPVALVEFQIADAFTPALRERVLSPVVGYEQRALSVQSYTVTRDGKLVQCKYEQQRGTGLSLVDFCDSAWRDSYDPPSAAFDKDGVAKGWHITRVLLKIGQ